MSNWLFLLFGTIFLGFLGYKLIRHYLKKVKCKDWPVTLGQVIWKTVEEKAGGKGGTRYNPIICYRYTVLGENYDRELSLGWLPASSLAEHELSKISESIEVRFNPENPTENICPEEYKMHVSDWAGLSFLLVMTLLAFFFPDIFTRRRR